MKRRVLKGRVLKTEILKVLLDILLLDILLPSILPPIDILFLIDILSLTINMTISLTVEFEKHNLLITNSTPSARN